MNTDQQFKPVPTRAALARQRLNKPHTFQALVFEEPKPLGNVIDETPSIQKQHKESINSTGKDDLEFNIKAVRTEVLRFAMDNQRYTKNKKKMQIFQAIKLGAKPPKKPYKNYKDLLDERKRLKQIREERRKFHQLGKNQTGAASVKCRSKGKIERQKKERAPVTAIDQHYGVAKPKLKKKK